MKQIHIQSIKSNRFENIIDSKDVNKKKSEFKVFRFLTLKPFINKCFNDVKKINSKLFSNFYLEKF